MNTNMLFKWRRDQRAGLLTGPTTEYTKLLPVELKPSSPAVKPASGASRASAIEITIAAPTACLRRHGRGIAAAGASKPACIIGFTWRQVVFRTPASPRCLGYG